MIRKGIITSVRCLFRSCSSWVSHNTVFVSEMAQIDFFTQRRSSKRRLRFRDSSFSRATAITYTERRDVPLLQKPCKSAEEAKKSNLGLFAAEITVCVLIILMCTIGIALFPSLDVPSNIIFSLAVNYLPFVLGAVVLVACVAFIVTTADSYLLSAATNVTYDVWGKYLNKNADDKQKIRFMRATILVLTILAVVLTLFFPTILSLQMTAYTMYGAAITPALLFALFSRKVTKAGGIAGILTGGVVTVVWTMALNSPYGIASAIVAVPAAVVVIVLVSALTGFKGEETYKLLYKDSKS